MLDHEVQSACAAKPRSTFELLANQIKRVVRRILQILHSYVGMVILLFRYPVEISGVTKIAVALSGLFVLGSLASWHVDFISIHFNSNGLPLIFYQAWRVLFSFFMFGVLRGTGFIFIAALRRHRPDRMSNLYTVGEHVASDTIIGGAIWIILIFLLALVGIFARPLILCLAGPACCVGLAVTFADVRRALENMLNKADPTRAIISSLFFFLTFVTAVYLFIFLGLGLNEFQSDRPHYVQYYSEVAISGSSQPNEFYQHFWHSKGAGVQLLSVLLLDKIAAPFGPLIILFATSALLFSLIRQATKKLDILAWLCSLTFLVNFIVQDHHEVKGHFLTMGFVVFALWAIAKEKDSSKLWGRASWQITIVSIAAIVTATPFAPLLAGWFGMLACISLAMYRREAGTWGSIRPYAIPAIAVTVTAFGILLLNYMWIGMAEATPYKFFFDHADQNKLSRFVSPYLILLVQESIATETGNVTGFNLLHLDWWLLWDRLRFSYIPAKPWVLAPILVCGTVAQLDTRVRANVGWPLAVNSFLLLSAAVLALIINQPGSLERSFVFCFPVALCMLGLCLVSCFMFAKLALSAGIMKFAGPQHARAFSALPYGYSAVLGCVLALAIGWFVISKAIAPVYEGQFPGRLKHDLRFVLGRESIAENVNTLPVCLGFSNRLAEIENFRPSWRVRANVWALSFIEPIGCFFMPSARLLIEMRNAMGPHWQRIVFGTEAVARSELAELDVRYFYVDFDYRLRGNPSAILFGCMAYSDLFSTDSLRENFRVIWRDGTQTFLELVQPSAGGARLPEEMLTHWEEKKAMKQYGVLRMKELCERVRGYYTQKGERWPVQRDLSLPTLAE